MEKDKELLKVYKDFYKKLQKRAFLDGYKASNFKS